MSPSGLYLSLLLLTLAASIVLWWQRPAVAAKLVALTNRTALVWVQLALYVVGVGLFAYVDGAPDILVGALMYQFLAPFMLRWVGSLFSSEHKLIEGSTQV